MIRASRLQRGFGRSSGGIVCRRGRSSAYKLGLILCLTRQRRRWSGI
ncbi:hypothetical protein PAHAL_1G171900 [Panicum hallii]|uniref:Uncharacterized protein n=1 Tax=Panicum hallii TaxID=206008 RepID=A0A2T8KVI1_9POAL|nr:hypothetical protein PAHAL_1G171900 [Panicum hallii]